jgi:hypothetical protein
MELTLSMSISSSLRAISRLISEIGIFFASEKVRCRSRIGVLKVRVSISSDPAAYTWKLALIGSARIQLPFQHELALHIELLLLQEPVY